ncbi:ribosomal protein S18-alanine N-acetyltransferase [Psychrobacter frigidicola]|uniref:ribosomal protein S18-alanine N-acetyltransferase n=1 Tax=Psychrobacter frigidicola TaxID=45611 RepID=UPI00191AB490|nr:ribosomal protein S18-alanine N-acetyltransferase [Psychrobacter frigidicola]
MLIIKQLSAHATGYNQALQQVADIEASVQPHDAWNYQVLSELLAQDSIHHLSVVYSNSDVTGRTNNKIVGYCLYQIVFEQAEILRIGTHPHYQRQGTASQLFIALNKEMEANKVNSLLLEVRADNVPAIALYEKQGFVIIHRRKGYYQQPQQPAIDALIMQRSYSIE